MDGPLIVSFGDRATEDLYHNRPTSRARRFPSDIVNAALVKMDMLDAACAVVDLAAPPGNRLEALHGDLRGFYSIRVNSRWRLVFRWERGSAHDVRLTDYHK
jgi:proteic killer suppression protein